MEPTSEVSGSGTFTITRSFLLPDPLEVHFEFLGTGTATYGADYNSTPAATLSGTSWQGRVTFVQGEETVDVTVKPFFDLDASTSETTGETILFRIVPDEAYNIGVEGEDSVTIPNYAHSTVSVTAPDAAMTEGPGTTDTGRFTVARDAASDTTGELTVRVQLGGSAAADQYTVPALGAGNTVVIPANALSRDITITPVDDAAQEVVKTVTLAVQEPTGIPNAATHYVVGTTPATISLNDDDRPSVNITATDNQATESGGTASTGTAATFTLTRTSTLVAVDVNVVIGGTAVAADYNVANVTSGQVHFDAGVSTRVITITAANDTVAEATEEVTLTVTASTTSPLAYNVGSPSSATATILDDDNKIVTLATTDLAAAEAGTNPGVVTITRTAPALNAPLQVLYRIGGAANATGTQKDYTVSPPGGTCHTTGTTCKLNFTAGVASMTITITPIDDTRREDAETVIITLVENGTQQYALGATSTATIALTDNDTPATDTDADGVADITDNCLNVPNGATQTGPDAGQNNTDADPLGDACDPDDDNDGLTDILETGTHKTLPKVRDTDGDGRGDGDEVTAGTRPLDRFSPEYRVSSVTVRANGTKIQVEWSAPAGSVATRYIVFRASTPTYVGEVPGGTKTQYSYVDETFPADGEAHEYHVQAMLPGQVGTAFNSTLASAASAPVTTCGLFPADTDGDGLCDRRELELGTDPNDEDTDGDGTSDIKEQERGTDPIDPSSGGTRRLSLANEVPFWIGAVLVLATVATLVVAVVMARRRS